MIIQIRQCRQLALLVFIVIFQIVFSGNLCEAIRLNGNGGYDIVIGIENDTPEPDNSKFWLNEIKVGIESFSNELWKTTKKRFFINSVDVLVPAHWWTVSNFEISTWQSLKNSEIRITDGVQAPNVVNPNPCGSPGSFIELPDGFFKTDAENDQYGEIGKALVNLWARYRFGVWEEHGIPGDIKFPYFHIHPSFDPHWEATGCSNEPLTGSFLTIDKYEAQRCDPHQPNMPGHDCRFFPDDENTANSSLLSFHYWQDSVVEFCDSKTHNYAAPNRHNLFCSHRSIWDVIRESEDYKSTKTCVDTVQLPEFNILKESRSPEFYVLLDRGRSVTPEKVLHEVMGAMVKFVGFPSLERINIAVGTYPHANKGKDHYYVKEEIGWSPISSVLYELQTVFDEFANSDGPATRDFGLAIKEVVEKIKQRNHIAGTVILVIKRGAGPNMFDKLTYEQEVIASVKEDSRIRLYTIEAEQSVDMPYTNLESLTEEASGKYHLINDTMNTARKLQWLLSDMQEVLEQPSIMNSKSLWVTQKQFTKPNEIIHIPVYDEATLIKIHLTTSRQLLSSKIILKASDEQHDLMMRNEKGEWDENSDLSRRTIHTFFIRNPKQNSEYLLTHECHSEDLSECKFFLVVTAETDQPSPRDIAKHFNSKYISIDVSTSTENNYLDMSQQDYKIVPFAIYARIEMQGQRVLRLENVTATVRLSGDHTGHIANWIAPLNDDGSGLPDVSANDGIYSGVFTPLEDGLYQISVTASGVSELGISRFQDTTLVHHAGGLMSKNQLSFGCQNSSKPKCISAVPRGSFSRAQDMISTIAVDNAGTFKPGKPMKILDFTVTPGHNFDVEFEFTSPKLLGLDDSPDEFRIYMAPHVDNFLGSTDLTKLIIQQVGSPSGTRVKIPYNALSAQIPYYAVEATFDGLKSGPSNVVGIATSDTGPIVPTPKSVTTTEIPSTTEISITTALPTTTEFPWPTTTNDPYSTTMDNDDESDEFDVAAFWTTTRPPSTSPQSTTTTGTTTTSPSTERDVSSTTDYIVFTTSEIPSISTTTTEETTYFPISDTYPTESTSTTTEIPISSTTEGEIWPPISASSTTQQPETTTTSTPSSTISTTEDADIPNLTSSTPSPSTSTTEEPEMITFVSSTSTEEPTTSTTTEVPPSSDITGPEGSSTSTTTENPITSTTERDIDTTTTIIPSSTSPTTEPPIPSSSIAPTTTVATSTPSPIPETSTPITSTTESQSSTSTTTISLETTSITTEQPTSTTVQSPPSSPLSTSSESDQEGSTDTTSSSVKLYSPNLIVAILALSTLYLQKLIT